MSKSKKIQASIKRFEGGPLDPHYAGFFHHFNIGQYYEAHDVLENLWLQVKTERDGDFYKGLIQLAGAFVHIGKSRRRPALALFDLAERNLFKYPDGHLNLRRSDVDQILTRFRRFLDDPPDDLPSALLLSPPTLEPREG